jgi:hypothetical protein
MNRLNLQKEGRRGRMSDHGGRHILRLLEGIEVGMQSVKAEMTNWNVVEE